MVTGLWLLPACDKEKDQYAGLSDLVAERQDVRESISEETAKKKKLTHLQKGEKERTSAGTNRNDAPVSSVVVYEKQIEILDSETKIPLAKGIAYMNKSGQIVKIKVYRK